MGKHTDDLRNVQSGDSVLITTTENESYLGQCTSRQTEHADPRSGEVRETTIWNFETNEGEIVVSIIDGLRSSADDPEFPIHNELWHMDEEESLGYIDIISNEREMDHNS